MKAAGSDATNGGGSGVSAADGPDSDGGGVVADVLGSGWSCNREKGPKVRRQGQGQGSG